MLLIDMVWYDCAFAYESHICFWLNNNGLIQTLCWIFVNHSLNHSNISVSSIVYLLYIITRWRGLFQRRYSIVSSLPSLANERAEESAVVSVRVASLQFIDHGANWFVILSCLLSVRTDVLGKAIQNIHWPRCWERCSWAWASWGWEEKRSVELARRLDEEWKTG